MEKITKRITKRTFYILSFTWGLPITLCGFLIAAVLIMLGKKPKRWKWCYYFEIGEHWGGMEWGPVFLKCKDSGEYLCDHEFGHALQNCVFGPFTPLLVTIPSSLRYWTRRISHKFGYRFRHSYYSIWFERQASELGSHTADEIRPEGTNSEKISG